MGAHVSVPTYHASLGAHVRLEGIRCDKCELVQFPPSSACANCGVGTSRSRVRLSGRGRIHAITRIAAVAAPPELAYLANRHGSYFVALIDLEEGPRVTGQLVGIDEHPAAGDLMTAVIRRTYVQEGVIRYGFKFRPVKE